MKNRRDSIFNAKLYMDAMRQLRLIGCISAGLLCLISVLIPIGSAIDLSQYDQMNLPQLVTAASACLPMNLIYIVCAPVIMLYLFSFLTKRNACDYFHSFPQTRGCLFQTYLAAAVTWITIITVSTVVATCISYAALSKYLRLSYGSVAYHTLVMFLCALLVMAVIAIACSVTGTLFSNVVVTGLILFVPRIILLSSVSIVTSSVDFLISSNFIPILDYKYNLIFASLAKLLSSSSGAFELGGILYTAVLTVIYVICARILFIRRKSETAGNASANRWLQCMIRVGIALVVCLIPISYLFYLISDKENFTASELFMVIVFYIIAVIIMLLYELLSTKKMKNVVRAIPSIGILFVMNVFILLLLTIIYQTQLNYLPNASEVSYVTVGGSTDDYQLDYYEYEMSDWKITDPELISLLVDSLEDNINYEKTEYPAGYSRYGTTQYAIYSTTVSTSKYVTVGFKSGMTVKYRRLYMDSVTGQNFENQLLQSQDIQNFYKTLPAYDKNAMTIYSDLTDEQNQQIYETLREEIKTLDYDEWYELLYSSGLVINLQWAYTVDDVTMMTYLPLSIDTPKTLLLYMNMTNSTQDASEFDEYLNKCSDEQSGEYNISVIRFNSDFTEQNGQTNTGDLYKGVVNQSELSQLMGMIGDNLTDEITSFSQDDKELVEIQLNYQGDGNESHGYYYDSIFTYVDKAKLESFMNKFGM